MHTILVLHVFDIREGRPFDLQGGGGGGVQFEPFLHCVVFPFKCFFNSHLNAKFTVWYQIIYSVCKLLSEIKFVFSNHKYKTFLYFGKCYQKKNYLPTSIFWALLSET